MYFNVRNMNACCYNYRNKDSHFLSSTCTVKSLLNTVIFFLKHSNLTDMDVSNGFHYSYVTHDVMGSQIIGILTVQQLLRLTTKKTKKNTRKNETKTKIKTPKLRVILPFVKGLPSQRVNDTECGSTSWRLCDIHIKRPILYIRNSTRLFSVPQYPESTKTIILAIHSAKLRVWYSTSLKYLIRQRTGSRNW